jgi:hypothetical protein
LITFCLFPSYHFREYNFCLAFLMASSLYGMNPPQSFFLQYNALANEYVILGV